MLAAKRSFGSLRAAARAQQCAPASAACVSAPCSPSQQQRSFMSAVLLSKGEFQTKTVVELRKALSERGLSTRGKKAELVDRLAESVSRGPHGAASSGAPSSAAAASHNNHVNNKIAGSQPPLRTASPFSTTARSKQQAQQQKTDTSSSSTSESSVPSAAKVQSETVPVHSPAATAAAVAKSATAEKADDELTAGPGLIIDKKEAEKTAELADEVPGGAIEMPNAVFLPSLNEHAEATQQELMIPEMPHTYKNAPDHDPYTQPFTLHPSWLKVDSTTGAAHHAGSSKVVTEDPDSRSSEPRQEKPYADENSLLQDMLADIGIQSSPKQRMKEVEAAAKKQSSAILQALEATTGVKIPPFSQAIKGGKAPDFKFQDRPLEQEEKTGLWTLGGILAGGFLLGSLGSRESKSHKEKHSH